MHAGAAPSIIVVLIRMLLCAMYCAEYLQDRVRMYYDFRWLRHRYAVLRRYRSGCDSLYGARHNTTPVDVVVSCRQFGDKGAMNDMPYVPLLVIGLLTGG